MKNFPAVSVIIPLYNAERYVAECLDSILAQTFTDFEVVVVDDCSTDNSVAVVESYIPKFGGRLTLSKTKHNSGGGGYIPRNIGLGLSRGEYVFFVDADDFITKTALEKLYTTAKKFDADVVYTGACFLYKGEDNVELSRDYEGNKLIKRGQGDNPRLTIDDPNKNLQSLFVEGNRREPWSRFVRCKFLVENEIIFPKIISGGDFIWVIQVYCCAKRFLRIPDALYFWRENSSESITRKKRSPVEQIRYWCRAFIYWANALNDLANENEFLNKHPIYCYAALDAHFNFSFTRFFKERLQLKTQDIYEILRREFESKDNSGLMVPFMFSVIDAQEKRFIVAQQRFQNFAAQAQKRIAELEAEVKRLQT